MDLKQRCTQVKLAVVEIGSMTVFLVFFVSFVIYEILEIVKFFKFFF